jgi:glycosyltransferase involved in cell wall biosynthesis
VETPVRVAMLVHNPFTHDTRVEKEARTLRDAGYEVTVVADARLGLPDTEMRDGIQILRFSRPSARVPILRFLRAARRFRHALVELRPHIIHAHDSDTLVSSAGAAADLHVPFIYDAHDLWLGRPRRGRSRLYFALNQAWFGFVERWLIPRAAAWITVSPPIARHLERRYDVGPVELVPNYPELDDMETDSLSIRDLPGAEGIPPGSPVVLYLGALFEGRGIESLVASVPLLPRRAHLVLLGAGAQAQDLRALALRLAVTDRIHIVDPVAPHTVVAYAASADVGVSPIVPSCLNYRYSLPNKLFQYMAAGLPVVASDLPQVRDVVDANGAGRCVDTALPAAVADAISAILDDPVAATRMGAAGRRAVVERYNWAVAAQTLRTVYERITPQATVQSRR